MRHQVGVVDEEAEWAVVSSNVFLEFSYVRSKWGFVALGDVVHGLMVPDRKGGCDWRCIHVFKVDVGGAEANAKNAAVEAQLAREEQEHRPPNPSPNPNPDPNASPNHNPNPNSNPNPRPERRRRRPGCAAPWRRWRSGTSTCPARSRGSRRALPPSTRR